MADIEPVSIDSTALLGEPIIGSFILPQSIQSGAIIGGGSILGPTTQAFRVFVAGTDRTWMGSIAMRADRGNSDDIYWADDDLSKGGYIGPGEAVTMNFDGQALIRNLRLIGTSGDVIYITIGLNSENFDYDA